MKHLLFILIAFMPIISFTQNMDVVWQQCFGTAVANDDPDFVFKTENGYFISTTLINSDTGISNYHGGADAWIVHLDTSYNIIWERCYGGSNADALNKIIPAKNNSYWMFGGTNSNDGDVNSFTHEAWDLWAVKIDNNGNILNESSFGSDGIEGSIDAVSTPDGGLIMLAYITNNGGDISNFYGQNDAWIIRIDSIGNIIWEKTFGNESANEFYTITTTSDTTYLLAGYTYTCGGMVTCDVDSADNVKDCWIVEIDINGIILWQRCYGGSYHDQANGITEVSDGYIVSGFTNSDDIDVSGFHGVPGELYGDSWVFKISKQGEIIWQNCLGGSGTEILKKSYATTDNCIIIFGNSGSTDGDVTGLHGNTSLDIWVVKLDWDGNLISETCYGSDGYEGVFGHNVAKIDDYNYLLATGNRWMNGDVECDLDTNPYTRNEDNWVFQIKDCNHYAPQQPQHPTGKDTLCVNTDSVTNYITAPAANAWYYEWDLLPEEAGLVTQDSLFTQIHWNPNYKGPATLKVRSTNDCGVSAWSDSLGIQTYMCLGTDENFSNVNLRVYPNPANSTLIIDIENFNTIQKPKIEIYNSIGNKVLSTVANSIINSVIVNDWPSGIYIVKVSNGIDNYSRKVIVN